MTHPVLSLNFVSLAMSFGFGCALWVTWVLLRPTCMGMSNVGPRHISIHRLSHYHLGDDLVSLFRVSISAL